MKKKKDTLFGIQKQQLNHLSKKEYIALKALCRLSKNMYNVGLYNIRQHFFSTNEQLSYEKNYHLSKTNENYKTLNNNSAQQILKVADRSFNSFMELSKKAVKGTYDPKKVNFPQYLDKEGYFNLIFAEFNVEGEYFAVPMSLAFKKAYGKVLVKLPSNVKGKKIKEIRIIPKSNARFFEIQYVYEMEVSQRELDYKKALAIDLGLDNLAACVTNEGKSFIVDGKRLKSINQWCNKENSRLQSIMDKQKLSSTKRLQRLWSKRNNTVNDYLNKSAKIIIDYCLTNGIGNLVIGYNKDIQKNSNIGKQNNQNFVNIPLGQFRRKLSYLCQRYDINFVEQEESYTSQASYFDNDTLPVYGAKNTGKHSFSGKRIKRGEYMTKSGICINADQNGALNILRKSNIPSVALTFNIQALQQPQRYKVV